MEVELVTFLYPDLVPRWSDRLQLTGETLGGVPALCLSSSNVLHHLGHTLSQPVLGGLLQALDLPDEELLVVAGHRYTQHQLEDPEYADTM